MAYPASNPSTSVGASGLINTNGINVGLTNSNNFDRLTFLELVVGNLLTDLPNPSGGFKATSLLVNTTATGGVGYTTGAGSSATQSTSKVTAFTLTGYSGQITFNNSALAGYATASTATWTNTCLASNDVVVFNHVSGGTLGAYNFHCNPAAGSGVISITNVSSASLSEAPVVKFAIIKGSVS